MKILKQFGYGRIVELKINNLQRYTPMFIPALSSASRKNDFLNAKRWVKRVKPVDFLISAYDYIEDFKDLKIKKDSFVTLDSGGYELRNIIKPKQWTLDSYLEIIDKIHPDMIISLDHPENNFTQSISCFEQIKESYSNNSYLQFVIAETKKEKIPDSVINTLQLIELDVIGIPEVNLGKNLEERLQSIQSIVKILSSMQNPTLLHILGCSDPEMIKKYALSGADIFDGLGWYRQVVDISDNENFKFTNFANLDSDCECKACKLTLTEDYEEKVFAHNYLAYYALMEQIREMIIKGSEI